MSDGVIHTTGKLSDKQILNLMEAIKTEFDNDTAQSHPTYKYGSVNISAHEIKPIIESGKSQAIEEAHVSVKGYKFQVFYKRGQSGTSPQKPLDHNVRVPSPYFDEIIVLTGSDRPPHHIAPTAAECFALERILSKFVSSHIPEKAADGANNAIDLLQSEMAALTELYREMLSNSEEQRQKLNQQHQAKQDALAEQFKIEKEKIDEHSTAENAKIEELRKALEDAKDKLDDRDHMHVRRQLRESISTDIQERVTKTLLPSQTQRLNYLIVIFTITCACVAAVFAYSSYSAFIELLTYKPTPSEKPVENFNWLIVTLSIRGTVLSAVAIGFLIYALGWMRKTYLDNVKTSNDLQRYALDINRASWTIETIMEMTTKDGRVLPDKWIEGVCHGLFQNIERQKQEVKPLDAWGALLNISGKAEIGPEGPKLEFNKSQTGKLAKEKT